MDDKYTRLYRRLITACKRLNWHKAANVAIRWATWRANKEPYCVWRAVR